MDIIQCCAPTNDSNEDVKEEFCSRLSAIVQNCPRRHITTMTGDFNAKTGKNNRGYEIKGQRWLGEMNDNGKRFADLCALNNLVAGGSVFQHKRIHKTTWYDLTCQQSASQTVYTYEGSLEDL